MFFLKSLNVSAVIIQSLLFFGGKDTIFVSNSQTFMYFFVYIHTKLRIIIDYSKKKKEKCGKVESVFDFDQMTILRPAGSRSALATLGWSKNASFGRADQMTTQ
jgi:hypothetical protein